VPRELRAADAHARGGQQRAHEEHRVHAHRLMHRLLSGAPAAGGEPHLLRGAVPQHS
jgi:hypothetical protein